MTARRSPLSLSLVVPVFNEEASIDEFMATIRRVADAEMATSAIEVVFVNDGSTDSTLDRLKALPPDGMRLVIVNFTRNFGKEAALTAGLAHASGDAVIPMDVDLQDPPELIPIFVEKWRAGADVVVGRRTSRTSDSLLKRVTARGFYRLFNRMARFKIPANVGDFRLMDRRVVEAVLSLGEGSRFMKGLFAWVGYRTEIVDYTRAPRSNGRSRFGFWRLWNFALDGILGFSTVPLRVWTYVGAIIAFFSFLYGTVIVARTLIFGIDSPGYASLISVVLFLGGIQLISLGVIGEYVGRIAMEVKRRPLYLVESVQTRDVEAGQKRTSKQ